MEHIWQQGTADNRRRWFKTLEMYAQKGHLTCSPVHITAYWLRERARLFLKHRHGCQAIKCTPQSIYHISARHTPVHRSTPTVGQWPPGVFQLLNRSSCSYSGCPSTTLCLFVSCKKRGSFLGVNWVSNKKGSAITKSQKGGNIKLKQLRTLRVGLSCTSSMHIKTPATSLVR